MKSGQALAFDGAHPGGPVGVEDDGVGVELNEEGGVADPSDADFAFWGWFVIGVEGFAFGLAKHLGDDAVPPKAIGASGPAFSGREAGVGCFIGLGHGDFGGWGGEG